MSRIDPATNAVTLTIPSGPSPLAIAAGEHQLWTANHGNETISWVDLDRTAVSAETTSEGIHNLIWGGGYVWVASYHTHAILRIDPGPEKPSIGQLYPSPLSLWPSCGTDSPLRASALERRLMDVSPHSSWQTPPLRKSRT